MRFQRVHPYWLIEVSINLVNLYETLPAIESLDSWKDCRRFIAGLALSRADRDLE
jgi:hypothetical protein